MSKTALVSSSAFVATKGRDLPWHSRIKGQHAASMVSVSLRTFVCVNVCTVSCTHIHAHHHRNRSNKNFYRATAANNDAGGIIDGVQCAVSMIIFYSGPEAGSIVQKLLTEQCSDSHPCVIVTPSRRLPFSLPSHGHACTESPVSHAVPCLKF